MCPRQRHGRDSAGPPQLTDREKGSWILADGFGGELQNWSGRNSEAAPHSGGERGLDDVRVMLLGDALVGVADRARHVGKQLAVRELATHERVARGRIKVEPIR